jgi:hypothetical protein
MMAIDFAAALTEEDANQSGIESSGIDFTAPDPIEESEEPEAGLTPLDELDNFIENDPSDLAGHFRKQSQGQLIKFGGGIAKAAQGVKQATIETLEEFGFVDEGAAQAYTELTENEREFIDANFKAEFGDKGIFTVADIAGQAAPFAALPAGGKTKTARAVLGALSGAFAGFTQFSGEDDISRGASTAIGGGAGAVLSPLMDSIPAVREFFKRYIGIPGKPKNIKDISHLAQRQKFIDRGMFISDKTGVEFKLSQLTGDPASEAVEQLARKGTRGERLARQKENEQVGNILKFWNKSLAKLSGKADDFGSQVDTAFKRVIGDSKKGTGLLGQRKRSADLNFKAVNESIGAEGTIPIENFTKSVEQIISSNTQRGSTPSQRILARNLEKILKDFSENRTANVAELQNLLSTYGDASQGTGRLFTEAVDKAKDRSVAKKLLGSLMDDLDSAASSGLPGSADLKRARDVYAAHTEAINDVRDTALGKLFGRGVKPTGSEIEKAFKGMKADDIRASLKILETSNPEIVQSAKRFYLKGFLDSAKKPGQADVFGFAPEKMLDLLKDRKRFQAIFQDKDSRVMVMNGIEATRRIMMNNSRSGGRDLPRLKELAGVIASRDRTFVARLAADLLSPEVVSRAVLTQEGVKGLQMISTPYNQNRWSAGLVAISNAIKDNLDQEEQ